MISSTVNCSGVFTWCIAPVTVGSSTYYSASNSTGCYFGYCGTANTNAGGASGTNYTAVFQKAYDSCGTQGQVDVVGGTYNESAPIEIFPSTSDLCTVSFDTSVTLQASPGYTGDGIVFGSSSSTIDAGGRKIVLPTLSGFQANSIHIQGLGQADIWVSNIESTATGTGILYDGIQNIFNVNVQGWGMSGLINATRVKAYSSSTNIQGIVETFNFVNGNKYGIVFDAPSSTSPLWYYNKWNLYSIDGSGVTGSEGVVVNNNVPVETNVFDFSGFFGGFTGSYWINMGTGSNQNKFTVNDQFANHLSQYVVGYPSQLSGTYGLSAQFKITQPSIVNSTYVQNTNPFPVSVYVFGGSGVSINEKDYFGAVAAVSGGDPDTVILPSGAWIEVIASSLPSWSWLGLSGGS